MSDSLLVRVTPDRLDSAEALGHAADPRAGAVVLFAGTVRDHSEAGAVTGLDYEAWEERALEVMEAIGQELFERWGVVRAAILHRTGHLEVGETSVLVCCSAPHRAEAFAAARHAIERVKHDVPIWKKELLGQGRSHWVVGS